MKPADLVAPVRAAARKAAAAQQHLHAEIRKSRAAGAPLRTIADAAGVSHEQVRKICGYELESR